MPDDLSSAIAEDPIAMEVFANRLLSISEEMGNALVRSSFSTNIKERKDCSVGLLDAQARCVTQAAHMPMHLGSLLGSVVSVLERYPVEAMAEGDAFICNDVFLAHGTHQPDITIVTPIFQSANYLQRDVATYGEVVYQRLSNTPQHQALSEKLARLEQAERAMPLASGMAAVSTALLATLSSGDHLLIQRNTYGGTATFVKHDLVRLGIALLVLWIFLWRSMMQAIGTLGLVLMAAFTAALVWLFVSWGWLDVRNATTMAWVVLVALGLILGVGMSWAIVRRDLTGQASVDEVGDNR